MNQWARGISDFYKKSLRLDFRLLRVVAEIGFRLLHVVAKIVFTLCSAAHIAHSLSG